MTTTAACESCGMPIETGRYCGYCTDETGALQSFDERFERMTAWQARRNPGATRQEIEQQTLDYMATMPAWRDHPRVTAGRSLPRERQASAGGGSADAGGHPATHVEVGRAVGELAKADRCPWLVSS
jgi:hypothetical protein